MDFAAIAVFDWVSDLSAVCDSRYRRGERDHLDGHVDAAAGVGLATVQAIAVCARRRLEPRDQDADGKLSRSLVTKEPAAHRP